MSSSSVECSCLLALYMAPLGYDIVQGRRWNRTTYFQEAVPNKHPSLPLKKPTNKRQRQWQVLVTWIGFQLGVYCFIRTLWPVFEFKCRPKSMAQHLQDSMDMVIRGLSFIAFANLNLRLLPVQNCVWFYGKIVYFLVMYSMLYETCPRASIGNTASVNERFQGSAAFVLNCLVASLIIWSVAVHLQLAQAQGPDFYKLYIGWIVVILTHLAVGFLFPSVRLHLHHHHWGWLLTHYAMFPTPVSETTQAMFIAFFFHGCAVFGVEPIFYVKQDLT